MEQATQRRFNFIYILYYKMYLFIYFYFLPMVSSFYRPFSILSGSAAAASRSMPFAMIMVFSPVIDSAIPLRMGSPASPV